MPLRKRSLFAVLIPTTHRVSAGKIYNVLRNTFQLLYSNPQQAHRETDEGWVKNDPKLSWEQSTLSHFGAKMVFLSNHSNGFLQREKKGSRIQNKNHLCTWLLFTENLKQKNPINYYIYLLHYIISRTFIKQFQLCLKALACLFNS